MGGKSVLEIVFCYPGFHAILLHRVAHKLYLLGFNLPSRMLSQLGRALTGIEIPALDPPSPSHPLPQQ